ncbi:unnamed protein product [Orchesella dallaii]|uniref:Endothelin-converting enzyme 1 n=1 Tax=Orchesella dallaii TaxID=48710 RepID=A0ABP1PU69_9HEXA
MESQVVENKGLPGNGLTDSVSPEEGEPLRSNSKRGKNKQKKEQISMGAKQSDRELDEDSGDEDRDSRASRKSRLEVCARKCRLTPKRSLIYLLFCSFLIFFLLLILIILAALWPSSPSLTTCQTAQCHAYSAQILGSLNASAEPCQDFWEFGCGGWLQTNRLPDTRAYWDSKLENYLQVKGNVRTLLNTLPRSVIDQPHSVIGKMKRFYDSCMATEYIEPDGSKPLLRIINDLGGWHALRDFRKSEFEFPRVLRKLHADHLASPYFQVRVVPDPSVPSRNIIKISPGGLSLPDKKYYYELENKVAEAFQVHLKDMAQSLGASSLNAGLFAKELFNYEKRIADVTPPPESLRDPVETLQTVTVSELRGMSTNIFWDDLLKSMFPQGNINDHTQVLVASKEYLTDISSIISSTDPSTKNNYLMWHLTKKYLPYMSREYAEAYDIFLREISGRRKPIPRWEFCIDETIHFFSHAVDFLLSENCKDRSEKVEKVTDMFESMQRSLTNRINDATTKFDESIRNLLLDKLRLMTVHVGTPFTNQTLIKDFYGGLNLHKKEWFTNVRIAIEFERSLEKRTLTNTQRDAPILHLLAQHPNNIQFLPTSNLVVVPELILQQPVLQLGSSHLPLLLGSVGVEIGEAIAQAFGIEQGLYGSGGNLMSDKDSKVQIIRDMIDQKRTCLVSFFVNIRLDDTDYIERTSLDTTMHLAGIQIALDALLNHDLGTIFLGLPALENFPPNALFFLSYIQSQCSVQSLLYHDLEHYSFTTLSHDHRTKGVLRQLVGFTDAMECPSSSELYADFSCGVVI